MASSRRRALHRFDRANREMILSGVLGQAATTDLPIAERLLDDPEGMFDPGARARRDAFEGIDETAHLGAPIALPAPAGAHGQLPGDVDALQGVPVQGAGMAGIGVDLRLCTMKRCATGVRSWTCAAVPITEWTCPESTSTPMCAFIPKYPCWPLRVWCLSRDPLAATVLARTRRRNQGGVDRRARLRQQAALAPPRMDDLEHRRPPSGGFQQLPKAHIGAAY